MKIVLFMIMCSGLANSCLEPHKLNTYDTFYDCMSAGYKESLEKIESIGPEEVNEYKIFIKFYCTPEETNEKKEKKINI